MNSGLEPNSAPPEQERTVTQNDGSSSLLCPSCGATLDGGSGSHFCPVCLSQFSMADEGNASGQSNRGSGDPSPEDKDLAVPSGPGHYLLAHFEVEIGPDGKPVELGHGAMGVTYKAMDTLLRRPVALKVIASRLLGSESLKNRFIKEARAAASLKHPNIASIFYLGSNQSNYFYAMELVPGKTLEEIIATGPLKLMVALDITAQVASALAAAHQAGLVHRDIKPANLIVSFDERNRPAVKVIDFGLVKVTAEDPGDSSSSDPGLFLGTPRYASPEQFSEGQADIRSDIYALGATLWQMLTKTTPFSGSPSQVAAQHLQASLPIDKLRHLPQPLVTLLTHLLEKDPDDRPQTPEELLTLLRATMRALGAPHGILPAEPAPMALTGTSKRAFGWLLVSALGVAGLLLAWFFFSGHAGLLFNQRVAEAVPTQKSIAVLPFENISANQDVAYFADGVQDEILNDLAKIAQLKVISRTSVMQYRADTKRDLRQIARALGVANVLEGTVRRDGNHVRVSTQLVDAHNDNTIWADSYDRDLTDIFAIQSDIAQTVASKLSARLSPEEKKDIEEKPTDNLEAYDLYLQGRGLLATARFIGVQREDFVKATRLLEEATRKDPRFALAYCSIAEVHDTLYLFDLDRTAERRALGDAALNEALRLRPDLPQVHLAMALHLFIGYRDYERARVQIAIAERALPNSPEVFWYRATIDLRQGRWEEANSGLEQAALLDPRNLKLLLDLEDNYLALRRFRQAEQIADRLIELNPDEPYAKITKAYVVFAEKAGLKNYLTVFETVPTSLEDRIDIASARFRAAVYARDWTNAKEILGHSASEEFYFSYTDATIPRECLEIWLARLQGDNPAMETRFAGARDQLNRNAEAHPEDTELLSALGIIDAVLGRKQEAIHEARRAVEILPISEDAESGPPLVSNLAIVYAWTNEPELAFKELDVSVKTPGGMRYGDLKFDPAWDPLRKDPRFDKLLAQLAPRE